MRFVSPETVRLTLTGGDWIEVKKELTVGEEKRFRAAGFKRMSQSGRDDDRSAEIEIDWAALALARVETYLVDWSAKKADGKDMPVSRQAIQALASEDFDAIDLAIQAHIVAMAEEKKLPNGSAPSTSGSV